MSARETTGRPTRWGAALVLLFLVDAVQLLLLLPDRTGELFAWGIEPDINAFLLGSAYVAGGYFFLRVCAGSPWSLVAAGFPPVVVFVWLAGIATFLHLDRLNDDGLPLIAWIALYVAAPILVPAIYLVNRRRAAPAAAHDRLPHAVRVGLAVAGGAVLLAGLVVAAAPGVATEAWPWPLTPLTARVLAAVIALYGSLWVTLAVIADRAGARIPLDSQAIGLAFVLLAVLRGQDAIDWDNSLALAFVAAAAAMLVVSVGLRLSLRGPASGSHDASTM